MAWRNCAASLALVGEVNARWPNRDKSSDGTIGDAAHATRSSDHNPWVVINGQGVVRARDIDKDGIDAGWLADYLRSLGSKGDPRLAGGGYIIWNRRITKPDFSGWTVYTGSNPHTHHLHVSFSRNQAGFDSTAGWGISSGAGPTPSSNGRPTLQRTDARVVDVVSWVTRYQEWANPRFSYANLAVDGWFGRECENFTKEFQQRCGLTPDGVVGPATWRKADEFGFR